MPDIRCPNCGKLNPDILDVCQFCQGPLKPESVLRIGDTPTKKNTGELEPILPDWLRDVRQQARDSAEEAAQAASQSKSQQEPPDLLAGLASQGNNADEDEIPDWLRSINPTAAAQPKPEEPSAPKQDFFAQFHQAGPEPVNDAPQENAPLPAWEEKDELSEWFTQEAGKPEEVVEFDTDVPHPPDAGWTSNFDTPLPTRQESAPKEEEDLSWLHNLEETARQTGDLQAPKQGSDWTANFDLPAPSQPASGEDLSWLDRLGGIEEPAQPAPQQPFSAENDLSWLNQFGGPQASPPTNTPAETPAEDLSWLNNLGGAQDQPFDAATDQPIPSQRFVSNEDLSWLNNLGQTSEPTQPTSEPTSEKPFSQDDLSWLNNLGGVPEAEQPLDRAQDIPSSPAEEMDWLKNFGGTPEPFATPPFTEPGEKGSRQTAPLGNKEEQPEPEPDWLRSATEAPSMPAPGDVSMDWFAGQNQQPQEEAVPPTPQPGPFADIFATPSEEPASLSNQDVDSLFSLEMPDWLSRTEPVAEAPASSETMVPPAETEDALAPVDLPSWVQAMRPVEAVISETAPSTEDLPEEREGPLAGLRGVIPGAPVGSSKRPKAVALKLQATDEQQSSAAILEQILGSETSPRSLMTSSLVVSQHALRWILTGLFLFVLSAVIFLRSHNMPVSASLPVEATNLTNALMSVPAGSNVLVVIDYEPSLTGEMEAIGSPLLSQMVLLSHPNLSFVSTSPTGSALAERLMSNAKINQPAPDGLGYQAGQQYRNLGFLPGGSAGVLGFLERPGAVIPASGVTSFSDYAALIVMTDHAESSRIWIEQLQNQKQINPALANQPLLVVASAQAGPLLQPYVSSRQVTGMLTGLSQAARYEAVNNRPGIAGSYWDAFGIGLLMSIVVIVIGSLWSVFTGLRARRAEAEQG